MVSGGSVTPSALLRQQGDVGREGEMLNPWTEIGIPQAQPMVSPGVDQVKKTESILSLEADLSRLTGQQYLGLD